MPDPKNSVMNTSNFINLIGRLGDNPKTTTLPSGKLATEFSLATNNFYRDKDGNRQEQTDWHRVKAYGKLAELFDQYLERGSQISIVGSMRYRKWVDKHEQTRTIAEVIADSFSFIGSGKAREMNENNSPSLVAEPFTKRPLKAATAAEPMMASADDDLPF